MYYSHLFFKQRKKISKSLIISATVSVFLFVLIILVKPSIPSRATNSSFLTLQPVNVESTQIGLFWQTNESVSGFVKYGKDLKSLNQIAIDERDLENKLPGKFHFHYMLLKNLEPNVNYYYQAFYKGTQSQLDKIKTPTIVKKNINSKPIFGRVLQPNNQPTQSTAILFEIEGFLPLLTFSKASGEWLLSVEQFIAKKTEGIILESWNDNSLVTIKIINDSGITSIVTGSFSALNKSQNNFMIGNNYNLVGQSSVKGAQTEKILPKNSIDILYPKENSIIPAQSPLLKGFAIPFKEVYITINSQPQYNFRIQASDKGEWKNIVSPTIKAGRYVMTMKTENEKGEPIILIRNFSIAKSGEQVLGTATPEASPTLDIVPVIPTLVSIEPTIEIAQIPTATPPVTGQMQTIYLFLISVVVLIIGAGLMLAF